MKKFNVNVKAIPNAWVKHPQDVVTFEVFAATATDAEQAVLDCFGDFSMIVMCEEV